MNKAIRSNAFIWAPLMAGVLMLFTPLLRDFHIESALLVALVGCFWSAWRACSTKPDKTDGRRITALLLSIYIVGIPLLIYGVIKNCLSLHGIGFWIFYPLPSVLFGYSLGRLLRIWDVPYRRFITVVVLLCIAVGVLVIEFFHFPQVYFFNHVWGGWPGPIYDETVKVSWSLVFYRGLTLTWAALFWWLPVWESSGKAKVGVILCSLLLIVGYTQLPEMGIISPRSYVQEQLGGKEETKHFILYYDKDHYSNREIRFIAQKHEFYYQQITEVLNLQEESSRPKIESYLYAHAWQKKKLVGAKFTSYVPVWLQQDQLHIAKQQIENSLKHELVHVLAKQFGNNLFHASWSVGLIEGLAVALAPNESPVTTIDQIVVSEKPYPSADEMQHALSPLGFYGGRSTVNYTQSGSFIRFLLHNYPVEKLKKAYRTGNISKSYQPSFKKLINEWHATLDTVTIDSTDLQAAARLYSFPSLFEQECPHVQSVFAQKWDKVNFFMAEKDTAKALQWLDEAREEAPENLFVKNRWAYLNLKAGHVKKVTLQASETDTTVDGFLLYADAFALYGEMSEAHQFVEKAADYLVEYPDISKKVALQTRQDTMQWSYYRDIIYEKKPVNEAFFKNLNAHVQARAIQQSINQEDWQWMNFYAGIAVGQTLNNAYFPTYIHLVEELAFEGNIQAAKGWLHKLKKLSLRNRYKERTDDAKQWISYQEKIMKQAG